MACTQDKSLLEHGIVIDQFSPKKYGRTNCKYFFLSHMHNDHMQGFVSYCKQTWSPGDLSKGSLPTIYTSVVTDKLLKVTFPELYSNIEIVVLPYYKTTSLPGKIQVTALESFHCDGSCMFLFENVPAVNSSPINILCTSDFRYNKNLPLDKFNAFLQQKRIVKMKYDDTFDVIKQKIYPSYDYTIEKMEEAISYCQSVDLTRQIYINTSILGVEMILRELKVQYILSENLIGTRRGKQLELLIPYYLWWKEDTLNHLSSNEKPCVIILGHRTLDRHDDMKNSFWILPTTTRFICERQAPQIIKKKHKLYVWFATHANRHEIVNLAKQCKTKKIEACGAKIGKLKCHKPKMSKN